MFFERIKKKWKEEKENLVWSKLLKVIELVNIDIIKLKKEVEMINGKLRSKIYRKANSDGDEHDQSSQMESKIADGFDELRQLRKEGL